MQAQKCEIFMLVCVYVNTAFSRISITVASGDKAANELDRLAGAQMAQKEGLVAGSSGHQTSTARLEHKPGFAGEPGITAAAGAGLRNALSGSHPGDQP